MAVPLLSAIWTLCCTGIVMAATALVHDWTLVTRNVDDVSATGVRLLNPFSEGRETGQRSTAPYE
jgi:hypothetical protein